MTEQLDLSAARDYSGYSPTSRCIQNSNVWEDTGLLSELWQSLVLVNDRVLSG